MRKPLALLLLLALVPAVPTVTAQGTAPALAVLFDDGFDLDYGWSTPAVAPTADGWHPLVDTARPEGNDGEIPRRTWYAAKLTDAGGPGGYSNAVNVALTSPGIEIPTGFSARSILVVLSGSSEPDGNPDAGTVGAEDLLQLQWALGPPGTATDFETLRSWSGKDLEATYAAFEVTSPKFLAAHGPITIRFRFQSDATCDSDPASNGPTPPSAEPPTPPGAGDSAEQLNCPNDGTPGSPATYAGWFLDRVVVVGRRDFVASADPTAAHKVVDGQSADTATVDLIADRGKLLEFRFDESSTPKAPFDDVLVRLTRRDSTDLLAVSMTKTGTRWSGLLAVDEPDLVAASDWVATYFGVIDGSGGILARKPMAVTASDVVPPRILVAPFPSGGKPVLLGPADTLELTVIETLLRSVTYTYEGLPAPVEMHSPYSLMETALPEGRSNVTFTATDRTGRMASMKVPVDRDTLAPAIELVAQDVVYEDVPFRLSLKVTERSGHTLRLDADGTGHEFIIPAGAAVQGGETVVELTPGDLGTFTVELRANDTAGNEAVALRQFTVVEPVTDLKVSAVRLTSPTTNVQREGQTIVATVRQVTGVAALPVAVTFQAGAVRESFNVTVPANGSVEVPWNATLPAGSRIVQVTAVGPAAANETNPGDESGTLAVEVFVGRVTIGSQVFNIRADNRGLPTSAVLSGSSKTYPLSIINSEKGVAYAFKADGNRTVVWDPLEPVQVVPDSSSTAPAGKDAPFPGLLMALLVVALAVATRRRR